MILDKTRQKDRMDSPGGYGRVLRVARDEGLVRITWCPGKRWGVVVGSTHRRVEV